MNPVSPTHWPVPLDQTRCTEEDDVATSDFLDALRECFRPLVQQPETPSRTFGTADSCLDGDLETSVGSAGVTQEAITAFIKNVTPQTEAEYVWDSSQNRWILKLKPILA